GTIAASAGGNAISLKGGASSVTLETGSVIGGAIAGNGTASTITLAGHGSLSGSITGLQAGQVNIQQNAVWTVSGNWAAGQVVNAGVLTAGLVGTPLTIEGNYTQTSTGTLRVVITPQGMSRLNVTGTAHLAGTLAYVLSPGTYQPGNYSFLTAAGGVSGDFSAVQVSDTTQYNRSPSGAVTITTAQTSASSAVPPVVMLAVKQAVVVAPADDVLFADAGQALALSGAASGQALLARAGGQAPPPCAAPATLARQNTNTASVAAALASGLCGMGGWLQAAGSDVSADGAYDARGGGFLAGLDRAVGLGRVGFAVGYDALHLKDEVGGKAFLGIVRLGLYGGLNWGRAVLSAEIMDGLVNTTTTRATGAGGAMANGHGNLLSAGFQAALPISAWGGQLRPAAGLEITRFSLGGLNEGAAAQPLAVRTAASSGTYVAPYLRLTASRDFVALQDLKITPSATLGLTVNTTNPGAAVAITAQDGTAFNAKPPHLSPVAGEAGLRLVVGRGNWRLSTNYTATLAGNWHAQSLEGGLLMRF
ncbi:MAG: autotransporter outer membrane beta-barrel domain-containing protein, partial [Rhodospirillales bacterium]|nr:autotransporter outer membrane beta-barrel domain-containing protein [Rhodospirillales bacterium]